MALTLLQIAHREHVAKLSDAAAGAPNLLRVGAKQVLAHDQAPLHALQRLEILSLRFSATAGRPQSSSTRNGRAGSVSGSCGRAARRCNAEQPRSWSAEGHAWLTSSWRRCDASSRRRNIVSSACPSCEGGRGVGEGGGLLLSWGLVRPTQWRAHCSCAVDGEQPPRQRRCLPHGHRRRHACCRGESASGKGLAGRGRPSLVAAGQGLSALALAVCVAARGVPSQQSARATSVACPESVLTR